MVDMVICAGVCADDGGGHLCWGLCSMVDMVICAGVCTVWWIWSSVLGFAQHVAQYLTSPSKSTLTCAAARSAVSADMRHRYSPTAAADSTHLRHAKQTALTLCCTAAARPAHNERLFTAPALLY